MDLSTQKAICSPFKMLWPEPLENMWCFSKFTWGKKKISCPRILQFLSNAFEVNGIPLENFISFAGDNARVKMGEKSGVKALLQRRVSATFAQGCLCHSIALGQQYWRMNSYYLLLHCEQSQKIVWVCWFSEIYGNTAGQNTTTYLYFRRSSKKTPGAVACTNVVCHTCCISRWDGCSRSNTLGTAKPCD